MPIVNQWLNLYRLGYAWAGVGKKESKHCECGTARNARLFLPFMYAAFHLIFLPIGHLITPLANDATIHLNVAPKEEVTRLQTLGFNATITLIVAV